MYKYLISITLYIASVLGSGEVTIFHHPSSLGFKGHDHLKESVLTEVYTAALGFSTEHNSNWNGLFIEDPFNLARAIVTVAIDGVTDIGNGKGHNFPLRTDEDEEEIYSALQKRVLARYPEGTSNLIRINLVDGLEEVQKFNILTNVKGSKSAKSNYMYLKNSNDEDREFIKEIRLLTEIVDKIEKSVDKISNIPDVYWFKISSLHPLIDLYGENSTQVKEAKQVLNDAIAHVNNAFKKIYNGRVLVSTITSDASHTRHVRHILEASPEVAKDDSTNSHNLAKYYSKDYPVIFNIILWFGIAMVFSLLAICIAIASMDPGRDSIIYRMTSTRLKKDN